MFDKRLFRHAIDQVNGRYISGWCFHRLRKRHPVSITFIADDRVLGSVTCHHYRKDLKRKGLHPTGLCGFDFNFPDDFDPHQYQCLELYFDGGKRPARTIASEEISLLRPFLAAPIWFMHIPKTAGTSFNDFARLCFPPSRFVTHLERLTDERRADVLSSAQYIAGHLPWQAVKKNPGWPDFTYYSLLREPYAHLHSHLNYVRQVETHLEHEQYFDFQHNSTIRALSKRLNQIDFSSRQEVARFVAGLENYELDFFDNIQTRYFLGYRPKKVSGEDLEAAVDTISCFRLVGLTEQYDCFRKRFCDHIGLAAQEQDLQLNKSESYHLFDPESKVFRDLLKPLVAVDQELYRIVRKQFWT